MAPELAIVKTQAAATPAMAPDGVVGVLALYDGNREQAARHLGVSRTTLWRMLKKV
jgi:propionate catabolism operon transcriptional regulator